MSSEAGPDPAGALLCGGPSASRLPRHFFPRRYDLLFAPRPVRGIFFGAAALTIEVAVSLPSPTRSITLHASKLQLKPSDVTVLLSAAGGETETELRCISMGVLEEQETITLEFSSLLPNEVGAAFVLRFSRFVGFIQDVKDTRGLFFCDARKFLSTHLEPTGARRLFPCFDEPSFRAVFQLTVEYDSSHTIVSGTPPVREEFVAVDRCVFESWFGSESCALTAGEGNGGGDNGDDDESVTRDREHIGPFSSALNSPTALERGIMSSFFPSEESKQQQQQHPCLTGGKTDGQTFHIRRITFDETPRVCSCIIGFNIGKFCIVEKETSRRRLLCRVIFPSERQVSCGWYALDLLTKAVDFFEDFFDLPLPLQKLDIVGLSHFNFLGMENWGMINMHLDYMLVDEATPLERRQRIARLIGHEVVHQWFGDWASIPSWKFLWLKEGFARYFEFLFVDAIFPQWLMWEEFLTQVLDLALTVDSQPEKTHPAQLSDVLPGPLESYFDCIVYEKGSSILRMMFLLLGRRSLQAAARLLLQRHGGSSFDGRALLECVFDGEVVAERRDVAEAVMNYAERSGYPLLYIEQQDGGVCRVTQYCAPDFRQGVLQAYVEKRQVSEKVSMMDLMAPRRRHVFTWNAENYLERSDYVVPVSIVELQRGEASSPRIFVLRTPHDTIEVPPGRVIYFNCRASGVMQCDYDTSTWLRIFEMSTLLSSEDRMVITITLFRFRSLHVGQDGTHSLDRCLLLLEWLLFITQSNVITASQWSYISEQIEYMVYMVRGYPCWCLFSKFVSSLFAPLLNSGAVSFAVREQSLSFESRRNVSRKTALQILQVLALCRSPMILEESTQLVWWALLSLIPKLAENHGADTVAGYRAVAFNVDDDSDVAAVSTAMQCLIEHSDMTMWWTLACVFGALHRMPMQDIAEKLKYDIVETIQVEHLDATQTKRWVDIIAPAVFAYDAVWTLSFLSTALGYLRELNLPLGKAMLRNKRFMTFLFEDSNECTPYLQKSRQFLILLGATYCSDSSLIALMRAGLRGRASPAQTHNNGAKAAGSCGGSVALSSTDTSGSPGAEDDSERDGLHSREKAAECGFSEESKINAMEMNRIWMDYCCDNYDVFLSSKFLSSGAITPQLGTHGSGVEWDLMERSGVSI